MLDAKGMRFPIDIILVCIRWYAAYPLSYEAAQALRKLEGLGAMALVALSGWSGTKARARASNAGFDHHLVKPAALATLDRPVE